MHRRRSPPFLSRGSVFPRPRTDPNSLPHSAQRAAGDPCAVGSGSGAWPTTHEARQGGTPHHPFSTIIAIILFYFTIFLPPVELSNKFLTSSYQFLPFLKNFQQFSNILALPNFLSRRLRPEHGVGPARPASGSVEVEGPAFAHLPAAQRKKHAHPFATIHRKNT